MFSGAALGATPVGMDAGQNLPVNDRMEVTSGVYGAPAGSVSLTDDKVEGKFAVKVSVGSLSNVSANYKLTASGNAFDARKYSQIKLWVKPGPGARWIKFLMDNSNLITNNKNGDGKFSVGQDLISGTWNQVTLNLSSNPAITQPTSLWVQTNDNSTWLYDQITSAYTPVLNIDVPRMINTQTQVYNGWLQFKPSGANTYDTTPTILVSNPGKSDYNKIDTSQADFQAGTLNYVTAAANGSLQLNLSNSYTKTEASQSDFQTGNLTNVVAGTNGGLQLDGNKALSCNGVNNYIRMPYSTQSSRFTGDFTFECELVLSNNSGGWVVKGSYYDTAIQDYGYSYYCSIRSDGSIYFYSYGQAVQTLAGTVPAPGVKFHLAYIRSGSVGTLYIDGVQKGQSNSGPGWFYAPDAGVSLMGQYSAPNFSGNYLAGIIDEVRFWNLARTQTQIVSNMNSELTGNETGLIDYWKFNEGSGTIAQNSVNSSQATLYGASWVNKYKSGERISPAIDLSSLGTALSSNIAWNATTPVNTSVYVDTSLSFDGGNTWTGWQACSNGEVIPGLSGGTNLANTQLKVRERLCLSDGLSVPTLNNLTLTINNNSGSNFSGYRESPVLDISKNSAVAASSISWNSSVPANTNLTVKTSISNDGGTTWQDWQTVANGGAIPGLIAGTSLSNAKLKYRVDLSSTDPNATPQLNDVSINVSSKHIEAPYMSNEKIAKVFIDSSYYDAQLGQYLDLPPASRILSGNLTTNMALSGDGSKIYYVNPADNKMYQYNRLNGTVTKISDAAPVTKLKVNYDGTKAAFESGSTVADTVYLYDDLSKAIKTVYSTSSPSTTGVLEFDVQNDGTLFFLNKNTATSNLLNMFNFTNADNIYATLVSGTYVSHIAVPRTGNQVFYSVYGGSAASPDTLNSVSLTPNGWKSQTLLTNMGQSSGTGYTYKPISRLWSNPDGSLLVIGSYTGKTNGLLSYQVSTKALRQLDTQAYTVDKITGDNKVIIQDPNYKYQIYDTNLDTVTDIRPADAKNPSSATALNFDVDDSGKMMLYAGNTGLSLRYLNGLQRPERYLLSFDGQSSWLSYKNGIWTVAATASVPAAASFDKFGMTIEEVNGLNDADFANLYAGGKPVYSFDVAVYYASTDPYITPSLKSITVSMNGGNTAAGEQPLEKDLYTVKQQSFTASNWWKINKIYPVEIQPKATETYYFIVKDGIYGTYKNNLWTSISSSLLADAEGQWIDSSGSNQGITQLGMTADELRAIPGNILTSTLLPASNISVIYAMKVQDLSTEPYSSLISIDYADKQFADKGANVTLNIILTNGSTTTYLLTNDQAEDFMNWVNERQYNRGAVFYRLKTSTQDDFINYYTIASVKVQ
jgi:hypothetical protein